MPASRGAGFALPVLLVAVVALAQPSDPTELDDKALATGLSSLARAHRDIARFGRLTASAEGRDVFRLELGSRDADAASRPAMLVVAGLEGADLMGTATVLAWAEQLAQLHGEGDEAVVALLESTTIHIVPRVNPDAAARVLAGPVVASDVSGRPVDDDHDGMVDEDGPDDLDGDGLITGVRCQDAEGEHVLDPEDERLLLKAEPAKGETAAWRYVTEGRDDDGDERWNEDGPGGVNFNRNYPFGYEWFAVDAGVHQVSEAETRALADFVLAHPEIALVVTFGSAETLAGTPKPGKKKEGEEGSRRRRPDPPKELHADDHPYLQHLSKLYRDALGLESSLDAVSKPGTFSDWMYFHRGRMSVATRAWSPELQLALEKNRESGAEKADGPAPGEDEQAQDGDAPPKKRVGKDKGDEDERNVEERKFLKWLDEHADDAFIGWRDLEHPDFPGKHCEVGGFHPLAKLIPPGAMLEELLESHATWLTKLAGQLPRVSIARAESKRLGGDVHEITVLVQNDGYLPTVLAHGETTRAVFPTRAVIDIPREALLGGTKRMRLGTLAGSGGSEEVRWIVHAPGRRRVLVEVASALGGTAEAIVTLGGE